MHLDLMPEDDFVLHLVTIHCGENIKSTFDELILFEPHFPVSATGLKFEKVQDATTSISHCRCLSRKPEAICSDVRQEETAMEESSSSLSLKDRVAIVTGGSRGIGRAIAIHLHSLGARVALNYASNSTQADLLASELNASYTPEHPRAVAIKADVSDPEQVKLLFDRAEQEFGSKIHILVNCAGVMDQKYPTLANTTIEDWDTTFNINTKGSFLCCREAANRLTREGGGRIIMISTSLVGSLLPGYAAYVASKAAVEAMTKILAKELKGTRITANCVAPGPVATELFFAGKTEETIKRFADACPLGRLGEPKDIAGIVGFLSSDAGEWTNGQVIRVNGGVVV